MEVPRTRERHRARRKLEQPLVQWVAGAVAWWLRYRKLLGLWALLASPVLAGVVGQQYIQHRQQRGKPPVVQSAPVAEASPVSAVSPLPVSVSETSSEASHSATGTVAAAAQSALQTRDADRAAAQPSAAQASATPAYEPARLPKAFHVAAAPAQLVTLPPVIKSTADVPLPLPAPLPSATLTRPTQKALTAEEPAGVKVTLKRALPAKPPMAPTITETAPIAQSEKLVGTVTETAR
ncbi:hypothetical protein [Cupriavidus sp. CuC1]|uniref:hypothetical protein n=1 Tax=Cupriavidus sp. CuC1 TaxID=3373131 RepID=UPI0037D7AF40